MIEKLFSNLSSNFSDEEWFLQRAVLTTWNERLCDLNVRIGSSIHGTLQEFLNADSVDKAKVCKLNYSFQLLSSNAISAALPDHELSLKRWYVDKLLQNYQPKNGHVDGSRYVVESKTNNLFSSTSSIRTQQRKATHASTCTVRFSWWLLFNSKIQKSSASRSSLIWDYNQQSTRSILPLCDCPWFERFTPGQLWIAILRIMIPSNSCVFPTRDDNIATNVV